MAVSLPRAPNQVSPSQSSSASSTSSSLLSKVRRRISARGTGTSSTQAKKSLDAIRGHLPRSLRSGNRSEAGEEQASPGDEVLAYTIAPPDHRENTALHAIMDSLPSLGSIHAPSISLPSILSTPHVASCFTADGYDSDDDSPSPPPTPPAADVDPSSTTAPRRGRGPPPSSPPPFPRGSSDPKLSSDPFDRLSGNVLMLGGYRGSVLRDAKTKKRLWIPLKVGFGLRRADLGLGLEEEEEERAGETVVASSMLTQVGGMIDLGKKLKERLKQVSHYQRHHPPPDPLLHPPVHFQTFGYDWRLSLQRSSAALLAHLERLKAESAARGEGPDGQGLGATVVAHSMGGLVVLHAIARARDPSVVRGVVFAGTPWQGCVNTLGPFKLGGGIALNSKVGAPEIVFSWRAGFYFLPPPISLSNPQPEGNHDEHPDSCTGEAVTDEPESIPLPHDSLVPAVGSTPSAPNSASSSRSPSPTGPRPSTDSSSPSKRATSIPLLSLLHNSFESPSGRPLALNLFSPQTWATHALSPAAAGMDFENPSRPIRKVTSATTGAGAGGGGGLLAGGPGNLGESDAGATETVEAAEGVQNALEGVAERWGRGEDGQGEETSREGSEIGVGVGATEPTSEEDEMAQREEMARLEQQAKEVETVGRYLERTLQRAREFQEDLVNLYDPAKAHLYPPIAILTSRKTPTVRAVCATSEKHVAIEGYQRLLWAQGDGIVLYESATRLPGDPDLAGRPRTGQPETDKWMAHLKGVVETSNGHVGMLGDLDGVRKCLELVYA
ncbi:YJR098C-like protein [Rhodotorula toruloides]|uniref:YJR098C-like protein n=1 Tax=Rhodotorula toruloides TaxID=5286 RepID=A0A511KM32_RHOTO|nr:YJR098C-like protein [Rhodotorula toruloides]